MALKIGINRKIRLILSLPESKEPARIEIDISQDWETSPPRVFCKEHWVKRDIDWHVYSDRSLCYIYDREWADEVLSVQNLGEQDRALYLSDLLLTFVIYLLDRHCLSEQLGITNWIWPERPHGREKAEEEYRCQLREQFLRLKARAES